MHLQYGCSNMVIYYKVHAIADASIDTDMSLKQPIARCFFMHGITIAFPNACELCHLDL